MMMRTFRALHGFGSTHYPPDRSAHTTLILSADRHLAVHCRRVLAIQLHRLEARLANWSGERTDAWRFLQVLNEMHGVCPSWAPPRASYRACEGWRDGPGCDVLVSEECEILEGPCEPLAGNGHYVHHLARPDGRRSSDLSNPPCIENTAAKPKFRRSFRGVSRPFFQTYPLIRKSSFLSFVPFISSCIHTGVIPRPDHFTDLSFLL